MSLPFTISAAPERLARSALDFCLPRRCLFCLTPLEDKEEPLCPACRTTLPLTGAQAVRTGRHFQRCLSPFWYTGAVRESFHRYKFQAHWHYSRPYARWMWECLRENQPELSRFQLVTWTPLSLPRLLSRGYDQSRRLAQGVARLSGLPLVPTLEKLRHTPRQSSTHSAEERRSNAAGVYRLKPGLSVRGMHIVLVDDIITTGATLEEAGRMLREAGAAELCCLTLASAALQDFSP